MAALSGDQLILIARQHLDAGRIAPAEDLCRLVLRDQPDRADALQLLSQTKSRAPDKLVSAISEYNRGNALLEEDRSEEAVEAYRRAIELNPNFPEAFSNLGNALSDIGHAHEAIAAYDRSIELRPDLVQSRWNRALAALLVGDFEAGWEGYKFRHQNFTSPPRSAPQWNGEDLAGKTILLWAEQGFGDTIQFIRYYDLVASVADHVMLELPPEFRRLLSGSSDRSAPPTELKYDFHCSLLDLPGIFKTGADNIPANIPYLKAPRELIARWREWLGKSNERLRVGIAWAGRAAHQYDHRRSISHADLVPLIKTPGVEFHSLQQISPPSSTEEIFDHANELTDFAETAALIANLDLVISVDTAVAHLAGAMGKPTWLMLAFAPDWRWQLNRPDSPWYPTMRLFRQLRRDNWSDVVAQVSKALAKL